MLSKSLFLRGWQCEKLLWFAARKELPEPSLADEMKFLDGAEVEVQAKKLFPGAVDLFGLSREDNLKQSKDLLKEGKTLFEASFQFNDFFIRTDILKPEKNGLFLFEIKAASEPKDEHIPDLAFQKFVLEKLGFKVDKCFILHLNKEYVKRGLINPVELIKKEDVSEKVGLLTNIELKANEFLNTIKNNTPNIPIGKHCNKPRECPLKPVCWSYLPEDNVFLLSNWRLYWKLFNNNILNLRDIPENTALSPKDEIIRKASLSKETFKDRKAIKAFLESLEYPLYHLDFETFQTAIPIYDESRPYQKIPFQFSVHIQNNDLKHFEFLASGEQDPRIQLLKELKKALEGKGSIITYHKSFEETILKELARDFPGHEEWINKALERIVDLRNPFKDMAYYNPLQKGSTSIKKVLPAITGKTYDALEIRDGGTASAQYYYTHIKPKLNNKEETRKNLLKYCAQDTEAMAWIINKLKE